MPSPDDVNRQELSAADAAERQAILDILNKRRNNLKLTARELAALRRYETRREADQRAQHLANVPQETLINLLQSTRRTVLKWENANMPGVRMDGRSKYYNLYRVLPWLKERWLEYGKATEKTDEETRARVDALVARAEREKLALARERGEVVEVAEVKTENIRRITVIKQGLMSMPTTLAPRCVNKTAKEIEAIIKQRVVELINGFAGTSNNGSGAAGSA